MDRGRIIWKHDANSWEKSSPEVTLFSTVGISWRVSLSKVGGGGRDSFVKLDEIKKHNTGNGLHRQIYSYVAVWL